MKMGEVKNKESFVKGADWKIRESKNRERVLWQTVPIKNKGRVKNKGKNFVKGAVFPVKIKGKFWSAILSKLSPYFRFTPSKKLYLFFTGRKLHPLDIEIEATGLGPS